MLFSGIRRLERFTEVVRLDIQMKAMGEIHPYENNPRNNDDAVDAVAKSIETFGFKVPLVIDRGGVIVCGHTRYRAAEKLGLKEVPCIVADDLTPEQIKAFRLADNKVGELAQWDTGLLAVELDELAAACDLDMAEFGFDMSNEWRRQAAWKHAEKLCDLRTRLKQRKFGNFICNSFFETGKRGEPIDKIKENPANVQIFADCLVDYALKVLGNNLAAGGWCLMTAPRRRHKEGFHFATEICRAAAKDLAIPFYADAVIAKDRNRIEPVFTLEVDPRERNVLIFDDIITTGQTARTMRELLLEKGHVVLIAAGIKN